MNLILGQFKAGFEAQPIAHSIHIWNFLGMTLSGLAFSLSGGCPGRQLILSGEGDTDAGLRLKNLLDAVELPPEEEQPNDPVGDDDAAN
jgi:hypothetical protein